MYVIYNSMLNELHVRADDDDIARFTKAEAYRELDRICKRNLEIYGMSGRSGYHIIPESDIDCLPCVTR